MLLFKAREFIKYYFINNIVNTVILLINIIALLSISIFLYSKSVNADELEIQPREFRSDPKVLIFKHESISAKIKWKQSSSRSLRLLESQYKTHTQVVMS